jgi:NitT/TauT family transport system ATP-binding protein
LSTLALRDVAKIFPTPTGYATAVSGVSLDVQSGEFVCILGASGCGKTTVLNLVAGFTRPTYGEITLDGRPISGPGPDRGVVFQQHAVFPWMSVEENVGFGLRIRHVPKRERQERVEHHLRLVGLWDVRRAWPRVLSGGMKQRVAIARALCSEPQVLLMDEPFGALDALTRRNMQREAERIWLETGRTTLFVTHSIDEAMRLGDRVVLMAKPGHVVDVFDVSLPRPRDDADPHFIRLRQRIETALYESISEVSATG